MPPHHTESTHRPACMQRLGLMPPFSLADVKQAYRERAKAAHPDGGGTAGEFAALHADYELALSLAGFHESRRKWLGERVEQYAARSQFITQLEHLGGQAVLQQPDSYIADFGPDYALILCEVVSVQLTGPSITDAALSAVSDNPVFREVHLLDLAESQVTDAGLLALTGGEFRGLNLRSTQISAHSLPLLQRFPKLEWLHLGQTGIGLWNRWRFSRTCPHVELVTDPAATPPDFDSLEYRQLKLMQRLSDDLDR